MPRSLDPSPSESGVYPSNAYAWYCVFLLMAVFVNSFLDRQILSLLVGPIRQTMGLSDTQVGFLMGPAFAIFYTVAGLPLGWLADRAPRRWIVVVGQVFWSAASVAFGLARTYPQLVLARIGVGVGEASLSPSAYSLIADLFPPRKVGRALGVYSMGIYLGVGLALLAGGAVIGAVGEVGSLTLPLVGERLAWQVVFFCVALPTLPLSLLLLFTFREPTRKDSIGHGEGDAGSTVAARNASLREFAGYARANSATVASHAIGFALLSLSGYGAGAWLPELFIRVHGWDRAAVGQALGLNVMIAGVFGVWLGGWLSDWLQRRGYADARMRVGLIAAVAWFPSGLLLPFAPSGWIALALAVPTQVCGAMPWGAAAAAIQEYVPNRMRGQAAALFLLAVNLVGLGLGPVLLPLITDYVFRDPTQIHLSLFVVTTSAQILAAIVLWRGLPHFRATRAYRQRWIASSDL